MHSHVVLTSAERENGSIAAVRSRPVLRAAREVGAYYRAHLAGELRQLGYAIEPAGDDGRYFRIGGISEGMERAFSARTEEVQRAAREFRAKHGREPERGELRDLAVRTRERKSLPRDAASSTACGNGAGWRLASIARWLRLYAPRRPLLSCRIASAGGSASRPRSRRGARCSALPSCGRSHLSRPPRLESAGRAHDVPGLERWRGLDEPLRRAPGDRHAPRDERTSRLHPLLAAVDRHGASLVAIGDPRQLPSIGAGGMFEHIAERVPAAELTEVRRTSDVATREAWRELREGDAARAMAHYRAAGRLHFGDTRVDAIEAAARRYDELTRELGHERVALVTDASNVEIDMLNLRIQVLRRERGELSPEAIEHPDGHLLHGADRVVWTRSMPVAGAPRVAVQPPALAFEHADELPRPNGRKSWAHAAATMPRSTCGRGRSCARMLSR